MEKFFGEFIFEERKVFKDDEGYFAIIYRLLDKKEIYKVKIGKQGEPCHKYGQDQYFNQFAGVLGYIDYIMPIIKTDSFKEEIIYSNFKNTIRDGEKINIIEYADSETITIGTTKK